MKLEILKKYYTYTGEYQGRDIIIFTSKFFSIKWFTDCGSWFFNVFIGKRWYRFSDCGFMKGVRDC